MCLLLVPYKFFIKFLDCSIEIVDLTSAGDEFHIFDPKHSRILALWANVYERISKQYILAIFAKCTIAIVN